MNKKLNFNRFGWVLSIQKTFSKFVKGKITIRELANSFCMLGVGKKFLDDNTLSWPESRIEQEFNEIIHQMCIEYNVLDVLRGYFAYDSELDDEHDLKIACKPYDLDLVEFLTPEPNPKYFSSNYKD